MSDEPAEPTGPSEAAELTALADPIRRGLFDYVTAQAGPVRRDDAATAVGISRTLAAYHLDRLAEAGLLSVSFARPGGRGGPGAGRPAKQYAPARDEVAITIPPRRYDLLATLLADAVADDPSGATRTALRAAAEREGLAAGAEAGTLEACLERRGYDPVRAPSGTIDLRNCPFHQAAQRQREVVCGLNHALVRGVLTGRGEDPDRAELAPRDGYCCVAIRAAAPCRSGVESSPS